MDKLRQKSKKEKPIKYVDKNQAPVFITDVKTIKENLKIKEILRTVKMTSSMRIKAPRGSKVMQNKDFIENEDLFGDEQDSKDLSENYINNEDQAILEPPSATNPDVIVNVTHIDPEEEHIEDPENKTADINGDVTSESDIKKHDPIDTTIHESISVPEGLSDFELISNEEKQNISPVSDIVKIGLLPPSESTHVKTRDRKLSLDQTMLSRRGGLSQSELDLNSIGKSPLERKSSFFRKKMDSFLRNTTEIFKRQTSTKSQGSGMQRRGSMSVSLQSLNVNTACNGDYERTLHQHQEEIPGSLTSLQSSLTAGHSGSSLSMSHSERNLPELQSEGDSVTGSRPALSGSQFLGDMSSHSIHSLNEAYIQESLLNTRAISMSSGLDTAHGESRRRSRANRVTWLASEGLTNYLRRVIQDESSRELNACHSYQDFSSIPENNPQDTKTDTKGRRLSYQRAVSGEDPRYLESRRKQHVVESSEVQGSFDLSDLLADFSKNGIPPLKGYSVADIQEESFEFILWIENPENVVNIFDWKEISSMFPTRHDGLRRRYPRPDKDKKDKKDGDILELDPEELEQLEILHRQGFTPNGAQAAAQEIKKIENAPPKGEELNTDQLKLPTAAQESDGLNKIQGVEQVNLATTAQESEKTWTVRPKGFPDLKLNHYEETRQAVVRELIFTEADYIRHLLAIVEVFIAAAHALQDAGKLLDVDTEKLFTNIPDVLNASLYFWEYTLFPMISDAIVKKTAFNTDLMSEGFMQFREIFFPYEEYVHAQTSALDYLRSLSSHTDFMTYLTWCHGQKACNRLQLSDIMVKPMQRLTKYSLILRRLIAHTDSEPERTALKAMESCAKNYVLDLNRSIRQREELEKMERLANSIEPYEMDFKDEDLDRFFRMYNHLNLRAPMANCSPNHSRTLIHQGDFRFKDNMKELEARIFVLTDMMLVCKKNSKSPFPYKLIRPKLMIDKLVYTTKTPSKGGKDGGLVFVCLDGVGSSHYAFTISESAKETQQGSLKIMENKIREAKLTYELSVWFTKNPSRDLTEMEMDSSSDYGLGIPVAGRVGVKVNKTTEDLNIERDARERVAAMLHRSMGASTDADISQATMNTDSFDADPSSGKQGPHGLRYPMKRNSTGGSSRNSRLSSFQQSTSAASHDEPQPGPSRIIYRAGSSVEHVIPPQNPDDAVTSITVNVVSESGSETVVPAQQQQHPPPMVVLQQSSPHRSASSSRSPSASRNTLRVQPQNVVMALVHSLPDLTIDPSPTPPRQHHSPSPQSASEKLYQSHQELLQRNRLSAQQHQQHYLTPDHRGTSYPPPSPTRASLKRGLAFSYSFKNPPLSKMGHVYSQSQVQGEAGPSTGQAARGDRSPTPGPSGEKTDKKTKNISSRNKGGSSSGSRKDDKTD